MLLYLEGIIFFVYLKYNIYRKHNYALRLYQHAVYGGIPKSHILPLFGQISLILLVQPLSLANPLGQGTLDVFYVEAGILLEKLFCILQVKLRISFYHIRLFRVLFSSVLTATHKILQNLPNQTCCYR
jgi:hypothetical protein